MLSLKGGYHTEYKSNYDNGLPGGFIFDASFSYGINKFMTLGANFEYWYKKNGYKPDVIGMSSQNISAIGFGANLQLRKSVFNILNLYIGVGFGHYSITRKYFIYRYYSEINENYLSLFALFGLDVKLYKNLFLSGECNLMGLIGMINLGGGESSPGFINIKIGPTYLFKLSQ